MSATSFDELVRQEQDAVRAGSAASANPFRERDEWLERLDELYRQVEGFLTDYLESGTVKIAFEPVQIEEEEVGTYSAQEMLVLIGRKTVRLDPVGRFLLTLKGRVDVIGPSEKGRIVLMDKSVRHISELVHGKALMGNGKRRSKVSEPASEIEWVWKIMGRPPHMEIVELTKESFLSLLAEVAGG